MTKYSALVVAGRDRGAQIKSAPLSTLWHLYLGSANAKI
jgi:hypothetical protein